MLSSFYVFCRWAFPILRSLWQKQGNFTATWSKYYINTISKLKKKFVKIRLCHVKCHTFFNLFIRTTIVVLGSFLDTFQKIADAASNTKGNLYFTSNIPIAKGSVIFRRYIYLSWFHWDTSKICILLWFYDKLEQLRNRQKSYFLQNGCYHCLWLGS